ncbi:MAG: hypothetical protein SGPRY_006979 [Prymnesium sp.]
MFAFIAHAIAHEEVSCFALVAVVVRDRWFMLWGARKLAVKYKRFSWLRAMANCQSPVRTVANLIGSFTSSYPVTGSFSRSAVNNMVGGKTNLSGAITGLLVVFILLVLTEPFKFLPKFCLAAIVISSVTNLIDYPEALHLWKIKKPDFVLWMLAFFGTLFLGVQNGMDANAARHVEPTLMYCLTSQDYWSPWESLGQFVPGVLIVRLGASMYFANVAYIRDHILKCIHEFSGGLPSSALTEEPVRYVVIEMTPVISVDSTAVHMIEDMHRDLKARDIRIAFATVGNRVEQTLRKAGTIEKIGAHWFCPSVHAAVQLCMKHQNNQASKRNFARTTKQARGSLDVHLEEEDGTSEDMQQTKGDRLREGGLRWAATAGAVACGPHWGKLSDFPHFSF